MSYETEGYIPEKLPEKVILVGGGQFANQFMIVNVLEIKAAPHPMRGHESETVKQATVEQQSYKGIEIFEPYLLSWSLEKLGEEYKNTPLDTYTINSDGTALGRHTKYLIKAKDGRLDIF